MTKDLARRRTRNPIQLTVHTADSAPDSDAGSEPVSTALPGWALAVIAGLVTGLCGWLLVALLVLIGWSVDRPAGGAQGADGIGPVLSVTTQLWLLASGGGLQLGEVRWTLAPLSITLLLFLLVTLATVLLVRRRVRTPGSANRPLTPAGARVLALGVMGGYLLVVLLLGFTHGSPAQVGRAVAGALLLTAIGAFWGASRVTEIGLARLLPSWSRCVPGAAAAAVGTVGIGALAALITGIVLHRERIGAISQGLGAEGASAVVLVLAQLAYLPTLLIWAASWVLGSGFTLGDGTLVSPAATNLGVLPSIPVLGALPAEGPGYWSLSWLTVGVLAGVVAGVVVLRRRPQARLEEATGVSFLAGFVALIVLTGLALLARGDLGSGRLSGLGPRIGELLLLGGAQLVLPAGVVGLIGGAVRHLRCRRRPHLALESGAAPGVSPADPVVSEVSSIDEDKPTRRVGDRVDP